MRGESRNVQNAGNEQGLPMIPLFKVRMEQTVDAEVTKVLHGGFIGQGQKVDEFEQALQPWVGRKTILSTNSCTSAIQLALRLSEVTVGDEVITTPVTCTATNEPIIQAGATIVWADVDSKTGLIDPASVKEKVTKKTKAIMAVHWGGRSADLTALREMAVGRIKLIEDAAHAMGAKYNGDPIGSHGDFVCFSFQAIKHLTTGDGGLLSCKSEEDYERGKLLRWYGIKRPANLKADIREWGYKFHMNDIAAAIGIENLKGLHNDLEARRKNARFYAKVLGMDIDRGGAYWFFAIHEKARDQFIERMAKQAVVVGTVHERNDHYFMFRNSGTVLPGVDAFCQTQVNLPCGPWVTAKDVERIGHGL